MTALLEHLLGRLPIGWLQLRHNPGRLAAALAGVAFANVLIFMQLGFLGALTESLRLPYRAMNADVLVLSPETNTLSDAGTLPRRRLDQVLSVPEVAEATAVYVGKLDWDRDDGSTSTLTVFGVDPEVETFHLPGIRQGIDRLKILDTALIDAKSRNLDDRFAERIGPDSPYEFEVNGRRLSVEGTFEIGSGFDADGYMLVSDQTFVSLFPTRSAGAPNLILVRGVDGVSADALAAALAARLPAVDSVATTLATAMEDDERYQTTEKPVGVIFGFGVVIGVLVGLVIVYQVLSTDVADHLSEYATLKAIGYRQRFFLGIVFEEAVLLALLGFVPGLLFSLGIYAAIAAGTGLPVAMTPLRAFLVLVGTVAMCTMSGALATRRLSGADPADLF